MQNTCAIFSSVACPAPRYLFSHYLTNGTIFEKIFRTQNICFDIPYNLCLKLFFILRRNERDIIKNVRWLFLSDFNESGISSTDFSKHTLLSNFMKIHPLGPSFSKRTDGHTETHDEANIASRNFVNAPKKFNVR
jgi:hypothetical protein